MARHLIQNSTTGDTRIVGDAGLPFFPGYAIIDTLEDGQPPSVFYGSGESDLRYVNVSELSDPESAASVALRAASVAVSGRRRMYDVRDYVGADDMGAAINRAIDAAAADEYGYGKPGQVILPPMNEAIVTEIVPKSGVDIIGSGWGKTVLRPQSNKAAFKALMTSATPLTNVLFADFEIDGSEQSGTYNVGGKGFYLQFLLRVNFDTVYIHDTMATGLGSDYFRGSYIRNVTANNCGRLNGGANPGGAGIGIGTGVFPNNNVEDLLIEGCVTNNNGRCGLFFETQSPNVHIGNRVVGHMALGNGEHGIADAGCDGLVVIGGISRTNGKAGFAAYPGTVAAAKPGKNGKIIGLDCRENGTYGFHYDNSGAQGDGNYQFIDCTATSNASHGMSWQALTNNIPRMRASGCRLESNGQAGIRLTTTGAGGFTEAAIENCEITGNGTGATVGGISINASVTNIRIQGGKSGNHTPGGVTQQYGIDLAAGKTLTNGWIDGIDCGNNVGTAFNIAGTLSGTRLGWIPGHNIRTGDPEGVVAAPVGTMYRRTDGGAATTLYVKESGVGATGWVAK